MHQRRGKSTNNNGNGHYSSNGSNNKNNMYRNNSSSYNPNALEGGRMNDTNAGILEQQNNEHISELEMQVARLKGLTVAIGDEVSEQNRLLDDVNDGFSQTREMLAGSLRKIGHMLETTGGKHMCYMVMFIVFVMVFLYWLMKHKGKSGV
eukprot:CAMPEP_0194047934 /NCGR_PEP_ID=MMETSP0009_2-20130614/26258_1 /TAXON_ID=210454 /ORGANISM="Grammatophora oceanica, Strain CCMP 410" /LENGTH=149 /DNA_ID=CAMNT_0038693693 /DNA_START=340 /DNA_END=792 /DNA_ORIENTATION=+